ncbi:MAG: hypothetical protein Q8K65_11235 [Alphaproteobacteria bacterium]|nr:hypothetical protein [Alphaproteobacteria bacterium]
MVLLVYLAVFAIVFFIRYRSISGGSMSLQAGEAGRDHYLTISPVSKKSANFNIRLGLPLDEKLFFKIAPEGRLSRILKSLGVAEEFQTGDSKTDALLLVSDDPALFEDLMQSPQIRTAIDTLSARHGNIKLRAFGHRLWLEADNTPPDWLEKNRDTVLAHLWEIADIAAKKAQMSARAAPLFSYAQRAAFLMVLHATLLTGGIAGFVAYSTGDIEMMNMPRFLMATLALVPLAAGLWIVLLTMCLRRSMWLVLALGDFILIGLAGLIFSVPLLSLEANRRLPQAPPTLYSQPLLDKSCSVHCRRKRGKNTTTRTYDLTPAECRAGARDAKIQSLKRSDSVCGYSASMRYKLRFAPFHAEQDKPYVLQASAAQFDAGQRGDVYDIPVYPGALGHAWLDEEEVRRGGTGQ